MRKTFIFTLIFFISTIHIFAQENGKTTESHFNFEFSFKLLTNDYDNVNLIGIEMKRSFSDHLLIGLAGYFSMNDIEKNVSYNNFNGWTSSEGEKLSDFFYISLNTAYRISMHNKFELLPHVLIGIGLFDQTTYERGSDLSIGMGGAGVYVVEPGVNLVYKPIDKININMGASYFMSGSGLSDSIVNELDNPAFNLGLSFKL